MKLPKLKWVKIENADLALSTAPEVPGNLRFKVVRSTSLLWLITDGTGRALAYAHSLTAAKAIAQAFADSEAARKEAVR